MIDVGGTSVKVAGSGRRVPVRIPSGPAMTARNMVGAVRALTRAWRYDAVSLGYPGPVVSGRPAEEPRNLAGGWVGFDFRRAFGRPVRIVNDASMHALGAYRRGRLLFLGLGTGLGSALVAEGVLVPLELAHLPYREGRSFEDYVGARGRQRLGLQRWCRHVDKVVQLLRHALQTPHVVLGGGAAKALPRLPAGVELGVDAHAVLGGLRLWTHPACLRACDPR